MRYSLNESDEEEPWEMVSDGEEDLRLLSNESSSSPPVNQQAGNSSTMVATNETSDSVNREGDNHDQSTAGSGKEEIPSNILVAGDSLTDQQDSTANTEPVEKDVTPAEEGETFIHIVEDDEVGNPESPETVSAPDETINNTDMAPPALSTLCRSLRRASRKVGVALQVMDQKVQQTTKRNLKTIRHSTRSLGNNLRQESERVGKQVQGACVQTERAAKATAIKLQEATRTAGEQAARLNEKYHITDAVAATATVASAALLAKGNVQAGAGTLTLAGASLVAGEALKAPYQHDSGLNERMHME